MLHNQYSINIIWTLLSGALVYFMQLGFAFLEAGFARAKNANHTMAMLLMVFIIGTAAYWVYGFALGWGNWFNGPAAPGWYPSLGPGLSALAHGIGLGGHGDGTFKYGLLGTGGFFLTKGFHDVGVLALFFFMSVFMETGITIPTGAMLERWNWGNFCLYSAFAPFIYCVFAGWVAATATSPILCALSNCPEGMRVTLRSPVSTAPPGAMMLRAERTLERSVGRSP